MVSHVARNSDEQLKGTGHLRVPRFFVACNVELVKGRRKKLQRTKAYQMLVKTNERVRLLKVVVGGIDTRAIPCVLDGL